MFLRQLDLTTALRPSLYDDEALLFVQDSVGLYEGKFKIASYQNGHAYLTSHRVCYVDNEEPRKYSVAVSLKEIERTEAYAGFLKSSPKITLFPKPTKRSGQTTRSPVPKYASPADALVPSRLSTPRSVQSSPASALSPNATWICPICGLSNVVPPNFDPSVASEHTYLPPCKACGIPPPLVHLVRASIAAMSSQAGDLSDGLQHQQDDDGLRKFPQAPITTAHRCPRCTFQNHPSLSSCEMCGASLKTGAARRSQIVEHNNARPESPGPSLEGKTILGDDTIETIKFSFRDGGDKTFHDRLKAALVQRKWLLQSAPPVPRPHAVSSRSDCVSQNVNGMPVAEARNQRIVGIAGLEQRGASLRQKNQAVIGTAFEDLEALMTSAKEVIQMAEQFAQQASNGPDTDSDTKRLILDSASALGLVTTKDMLGTGSSAEQLYVTELSRNLAEFLTDDKKGVLRNEGGIMSLIDLWQVFNRTRNGIELVSPLDFEKAAHMWDTLHLPIRLRRFKSGLLVVQERNRTDEKTIASVLNWLRDSQHVLGAADTTARIQAIGRGVTAQETAERFSWSIGVATEELEMAEEVGALCRDQCLDGIRFWENHFSGPIFSTIDP